MSSTNLNQEAQSLLDAGRHADDPTSEDRERIRKALMLKIGAVGVAAGAGIASKAATAKVAASLGKVTSVASGSATAGWLWTSWKVGIAVGVLIAGGASYGVSQHVRARRVSSVQPVGTTATKMVPVANMSANPPDRKKTEETPETIPNNATSLPTSDHPSHRVPAPHHGTLAKKSTHGAKTNARPQQGDSSAENFENEVNLLADAQKAMREGKSNKALELLKKHRKLHPHGLLNEESEAARVVALCQAGRIREGKAAAARFLATKSGSPLASRVRQACDNHGK
jgi:hypothetical protein